MRIELAALRSDAAGHGLFRFQIHRTNIFCRQGLGLGQTSYRRPVTLGLAVAAIILMTGCNDLLSCLVPELASAVFGLSSHSLACDPEESADSEVVSFSVPFFSKLLVHR